MRTNTSKTLVLLAASGTYCTHHSHVSSRSVLLVKASTNTIMEPVF